MRGSVLVLVGCTSGADGSGGKDAVGGAFGGGAFGGSGQDLSNAGSGQSAAGNDLAGIGGVGPGAENGASGRAGATDVSAGQGGFSGSSGGTAPGSAGGSFGGAQAGSSGGGSGGEANGGSSLVDDDFRNGLSNWSVELENGGTVKADGGIMDIDVPAGATVWLRRQFTDPIVIEFAATAVSAGGPNDHVTDLNMFWNAHDVRSPQDLFATKRTGAFADYDFLTTYYVGYGANLNTTTRMRRYVGQAGNRPLLFDLKSPLLQANHAYQVQIATSLGRVQYRSDGTLLFDYEDTAPYASGWFGFRTTASHFRLAAFKVYRPYG